MKGNYKANLEVFTEMCGKDALANVVLVTTGWEELEDEHQGKARAREQELLDNFVLQPMQYRAFSKVDYDLAWDIIDIFQEHGRALQIQREMKTKRWSIHQTSAYKALRRLSGFFRRNNT